MVWATSLRTQVINSRERKKKKIHSIGRSLLYICTIMSKKAIYLAESITDV